MKTLQAHKEMVGSAVFTAFEKKISSSVFDAKHNEKRIVTAAELASEMPFVMLPLRSRGILKEGERNTHLLRSFQPNLWAQDFAHSAGRLATMTVESSIERADAAFDYVLATSDTVQGIIKGNMRKEDAFRQSMQEAAMIEAAYYERLGGTEMPEDVTKNIDVALMKRSAKTISLFGTTLKHAGVDEGDTSAMFQFSQELDITGILQELVRIDPYFARRSKQIADFTTINAERSISLEVAKTDKFMEQLLTRAAKRYPSLFKRLAGIAV